jgi:hypothetical protein
MVGLIGSTGCAFCTLNLLRDGILQRAVGMQRLRHTTVWDITVHYPSSTCPLTRQMRELWVVSERFD